MWLTILRKSTQQPNNMGANFGWENRSWAGTSIAIIGASCDKNKPQSTTKPRWNMSVQKLCLYVILPVLLISHVLFFQSWTPAVVLNWATTSAVTSVSEEGWCGDWTPLGSISDPNHDSRKTVSLDANDSTILGSCSETKVGTDHTIKAEQLYCQPDLTSFNRSPAVLALDLQRLPQTKPEYSIVAPSHSSAEILNFTVPLVCNHTVGSWEIVFVLDGCWDDSLHVLKNILLSQLCLQSTMVRARVLIQPTSVFETSSDNLGFTLAEAPSHFYIELQSDMILTQTGWNRDLVRPLFEYNDIFSVSGRCGHGHWNEYHIGRCGMEVESLNATMELDTRDAVIVTATNNRGPIAYRADALQLLGFYDEVNFYLGDDDHDLNRRALFLGWHVSYKYVPFYAPLYNSPSRNNALKASIPKEALEAEEKFVAARKELHNHTCDAFIPIGSFAPGYLEKPERRSLTPAGDLDPNAPLPPLPPLPPRNQTV
jgi:hypothetical protein